MKKLSLIIALNFVLFAGTINCSSVFSSMPTVITYTQSSILVLDTVKNFIDQYFRSHPDTGLEVKVDNAISKTELALHSALSATEGANNLNQKQIDAAFEDFKLAYADLMTLVGPLGVNAKGAKLVKEADATLTVPTPLELVPKI